MGFRVLLVATSAALALASCGDADRPRSVSITISKAEWQRAPDQGFWPFTVDQGVLTCHAPDQVTFAAGGTEYALSDNARWIGNFPTIAPILVQSYVEIGNERQPVLTPFKAVTDRGLQLCP